MYYKIIQFQDDEEVTGCRRACNQTIFEVEELQQPITQHYGPGGSDDATLYFYVYNSFETAEEYLLFDGNAIISAVGGSLGLFLGFSCLTMLTLLGQKLASLCRN